MKQITSRQRHRATGHVLRQQVPRYSIRACAVASRGSRRSGRYSSRCCSKIHVGLHTVRNKNMAIYFQPNFNLREKFICTFPCTISKLLHYSRVYTPGQHVARQHVAGNKQHVAGNKIVASLLPVCCWIQRDTLTCCLV